MKFASGKNAWGMCQRCGLRARYTELVADGENPGLRVHPWCRDIAHPAEKPFRTTEGIALRRPSPDIDDDSPGGVKYLDLDGTSGNYASTPDASANSITGDIDIRIHLSMDDWTPSAEATLLSKWNAAGSRSYKLNIQTSGIPKLYWSEDGTASITAAATVAPPFVNTEDYWLRVTLDVNNQAGGRTVKFYTSGNGYAWDQLGATVTDSGTTSIFDSTALLTIGGITNGTADLLAGKVYYADLRSTIGGGTIAAQFNLSADAAASAESFTSTSGEVWTINQSGADEATVTLETLAATMGFEYSFGGAT